MTATQSGYSGDILTVNPTAGQFVNIAALNGKIDSLSSSRSSSRFTTTTGSLRWVFGSRVGARESLLIWKRIHQITRIQLTEDKKVRFSQTPGPCWHYKL